MLKYLSVLVFSAVQYVEMMTLIGKPTMMLVSNQFLRLMVHGYQMLGLKLTTDPGQKVSCAFL